MRYAIISDVHSNIHALKQALHEIDSLNIDQIICLGDVVGYNAFPSECIKLLKEHPKVSRIFCGNHDADVFRFSRLRYGDIIEMSADAYKGIGYSSSKVSDDEREWLGNLLAQKIVEDPQIPFWCSHYSPDYCTYFGYILNESHARMAIKELQSIGGANLFFFGHTHLPSCAELYNGKFTWDMGRHLDGDTYIISPDAYYLLNPGSIGQPRNGGVTSFAIFDTEERTVRIQSFEYNIKEAQQAVFDAGYSDSIANKLDPSYDEERIRKQIKKQKYKKRQKAIDASRGK